MEIIRLEPDRIGEFISFCRRHRERLDDSFLYEEDLAEFEPSSENPTYIAVNSQGTLVGAVSLILNEYSYSGRKARFRIFHTEETDHGEYAALLQAILPHTAGLDKLNLFVPTHNTDGTKGIEAAGFAVERYSYLLVREQYPPPVDQLPEGFGFRTYERGRDEEVWCTVRNAGFAKLQGSETPQTPEMVQKMTGESDYLEGGMQVLYHQGRAVGIVRGADDEYEGKPIMNIGPLALLPEYQGKGLGRFLLRAALHFADRAGYERCILCVNAENERAQALYIGEGFKQAEAAACFAYRLHE